MPQGAGKPGARKLRPGKQANVAVQSRPPAADENVVIRAGEDAGKSARAQHARRRATRQQRLRSRYGPLAGPVELLSRETASERAWRRGAEGEERAGRRLEKLLQGSGVELLHDRRLPGSRANIDHLAVGPTGVTVIDTKRWRGRVRVRDGRLWVAGSDRTRIVEGVRRQIEVVRLGLATCSDVPVSGAICWIEVDGLPWLAKLSLDGVPIDGPRRVARALRKAGPVPPARASHIARMLDKRLSRCD
jgi:hypothetical protein